MIKEIQISLSQIYQIPWSNPYRRYYQCQMIFKSISLFINLTSSCRILGYKEVYLGLVMSEITRFDGTYDGYFLGGIISLIPPKIFLYQTHLQHFYKHASNEFIKQILFHVPSI